MKRDPGRYDYLPYARRPKIEWPNGARVAVVERVLGGA